MSVNVVIEHISKVYVEALDLGLISITEYTSLMEALLEIVDDNYELEDEVSTFKPVDDKIIILDNYRKKT